MSPAPRDDDEDTSPPRPPGARPTAPATLPQSSKPASLKWGLVGSLHRVEPLTVVPGQTGVVRLLPNTLKYARPPVGLGWAEVKGQPGRFEMAWPGNLAAVRSLEDVAADLRKAFGGKPLPADHPVLAELDNAVFALLAAADQLARKGWGVGLLSPAGVMLNPSPGGVEAVLVDLGFTWTGEFGSPPWEHSPGRPDWLVADPNENPSAAGWDRPPVEQQFAQPSGTPYPPKPDSEVRTVAKVIGWALTGKPSGDGRGPVWDALRAESATVAELTEKLRAAPPSTHFGRPVEVPLTHASGSTAPPSRWKLWAALGGLAALAAVVAFFALTGDKPTDHATAPTQPTSPGTEPTKKGTEPTKKGTETPPTTPSGDVLKDYQKTPRNDLLGRLAKFRPLAAAAATSKDPAFVKAVAAARAELFADWIDGCEVRFASSAEPARRAEAGQSLRQLTEAFRPLHAEFPPPAPATRDKEQQWLDTYDKQAESLGWPR